MFAASLIKFVPMVLISGIALVSLSACKASGQKKAATPVSGAVTPQIPESDDETIYKMATTESVKAEILMLKPLQAVVVVKGLLPDGATRVHEVKKQRIMDGTQITITTARPRNAVASLALIPFERTLTVDLTGLASGSSHVFSANGASATLIIP